MAKLFKSAGNIDMDHFTRARSRSRLSQQAPSITSNQYSCNVRVKNDDSNTFKFKFMVHCASETLLNTCTEGDTNVLHYKFDSPFRNSPLVITKWRKSGRRVGGDKSELVGCFVCVPMRLKQGQYFTYQLHAIPKSEYYTQQQQISPRESDSSQTIELKVDWTRKLKQEMMSHWSFDKVSNISLKPAIQDISGKGYHVMLKNLNTDNPLLCHGVKHSSYAMYFSGFNYLICDRNPLKLTSEFTISFWFKFAPNHHTDDTILLSCVKSIENDLLDTQVDNDSVVTKNMTESELHCNELFYGPKFRVILNRESQYLSLPTVSSDDMPRRRSRSSSFTEAITDAFTSKRATLSINRKSRALSGSTEVGFSIGTKKNVFTDSLGNNLVLTRKKNQRRKQYDVVFGRILSKSLNDTEDINQEYLDRSNNPEFHEGEDEDVYIEDDDTVTETFERTDFFKKEDWNHLVVTYSGDRLREYINGTLTDDRRGTFATLGSANQFVIGAMTDGYAFSGFRGSIDELKIFNYALCSDEVRNLHAWKDHRESNTAFAE